MENFVLPHMPVFGCMYISAVHSYTGEYTEDLLTYKIEMVVLKNSFASKLKHVYDRFGNGHQ